MKLFSRRLSIILFAITGLAGAGCSFHSTQYEFVKGLVSKEESGPTKNWLIEWNGLRTPVYAVNLSGFVVFADEFDVQVKFEDSQITYVKGILPAGEDKELVVSVEQRDEKIALIYRITGEFTQEEHLCSQWQRSPEGDSAGIYSWVQNCSYNDSTYQNRRWLNDLGQVTRLEMLMRFGSPFANIFLL